MKDARNVISDLISGISNEAWKSGLDQSASKYHITVLWSCIVLDPLFTLADYFNIHDSWQELLVVRLGVASIILIMLLLRKKYKYPSYILVAITFFVISVQLSFSYSLIDKEHILGQNL